MFDDYFIAYNNCKDTIVALNTSKDAILDVRMPVMNGYDLYNEIRKVDEKIKICFLTAATDVYYEVFRKFGKWRNL